jgi:predicted nucleic acid-binding protein
VSAPPRAVLDSNVIFSRVLYELLGRVAASLRLLDLIWSEELLAEAERVLIERKPLTPDQASRWVGYLRDAFPAGRVDLVTVSIDAAALSADPADAHVCALALGGDASYLFTFDRGYLRDTLAAHRIQVVTPDEFLSCAIDKEPEAFMTLLEEQAAVWGGGRPPAELLAALERANAPLFVAKARLLAL